MNPNASGRANRVAPDGSLHAVADRGLLWGNRGPLLDADGAPARRSRGRGWVACLLEFNGRARTQWQPGRLTELYFLDEVTALAAGHRPCGECRHGDHRRFKAAWVEAHPGAPSTAADLDRRLHADRVSDTRDRARTHTAEVVALPDGAVVVDDGSFWAVCGSLLLPWSFAGYGAGRPRSGLGAIATVVTPRATVATLRAGYRPSFHPTAGG